MRGHGKLRSDSCVLSQVSRVKFSVPVAWEFAHVHLISDAQLCKAMQPWDTEEQT